MPIGTEEEPEDVDEDSPSRVCNKYHQVISCLHIYIACLQSIERSCNKYATPTNIPCCHAYGCWLHAKPGCQLS